MALIEARDLEKIYRNDSVETPALCGVSFNIEKGEFVTIMGPSGSGKSTLLHVISFLDRHTGGEYRFEGKSIDDYTDEGLARVRNQKMGFVFQTFNLLPRRTVFENVMLPLVYSKIPKSTWKNLTLDAIKSVSLSHRIDHTPSKLSGGERQRAAIARALVNTPEVIFADEPTGNLDTKSGEVIMDILQELSRKKNHTIVMVTHETYTAEHAERIIHLLDGKVEKEEKVAHPRHAKDYL